MMPKDNNKNILIKEIDFSDLPITNKPGSKVVIADSMLETAFEHVKNALNQACAKK